MRERGDPHPAGAGPRPALGEWLDQAAGPVVRPYALTGGRTQPRRDEFDLIAVIEAEGNAGPAPGWTPSPEHRTILELCRSPLSVAEAAAELDLALGVVRVLLGDLLDHGRIRVRRPAPAAPIPSERVLKEVIDGLHAL